MFHRLKLEVRYLGRPRWDTQISPPELLAFIRSHPSGRALDIGCGTGTNLASLGAAGWQVSGVDLSWLAVAKAARRLRRLGLPADLRAGNYLRTRPFPAPFNLILDIGCYHSLAEPERAAYRRRLKTDLAGGGTFLLYAHYQSESRHGIGQEDLGQFGAILSLEQRQDGLETGIGASVWLTFRKEAG